MGYPQQQRHNEGNAGVRERKLVVLELNDLTFSIYSSKETMMGAYSSRTANYVDCSSPKRRVVLLDRLFRYSKNCPFEQPRSLTPLYRSSLLRHAPCAMCSCTPTCQLLSAIMILHDSRTTPQPNKNCGLIGSVGPVVLYRSTVSPHQYLPSADCRRSSQTCSRRSPTSWNMR